MKAEIWKWSDFVSVVFGVGAMNTNPDAISFYISARFHGISMHFFISLLLTLSLASAIHSKLQLHICCVYVCMRFYFSLIRPLLFFCLLLFAVRHTERRGLFIIFFFFFFSHWIYFVYCWKLVHIIECGNQARIDHDHYCL